MTSEIPIENFVTQGYAAHALLGNTDARVWAFRFVVIFYANGWNLARREELEDFMTTWFANAIEVGRTAGREATLSGSPAARALREAEEELEVTRAELTRLRRRVFEMGELMDRRDPQNMDELE